MRNLSIYCLLFVSITLSSCKGGVDWDIAPVTLQIYVQDSDGNDLLNENTPNNILSNDIKVTYNDEEYRVTSEDEEEILNRAYLAHFYGLELTRTISGEYYLFFGEFNGTDDWDESLILDLGDGNTYNITFEHDITWLLGYPKISNKYYLDNKKQDSGTLQITK
ncbi:MAG: hypothetical protein R3Y22_08140 [Bacteroidales bacterium]